MLVPQQLYIEPHFVRGVLVPLYTRATCESPLVSIMSALSLRAFSQQPGREVLRLQSEKYYGQAVSRLNQALASPNEAKSDGVLLCILMLLLRETLSMTESSVMTWRQHILGATELVKLRGRNSFDNEAGLHLFMAVRELMLSLHLQMAKAIPEKDIETIWLMPHPCKIQPLWNIFLSMAMRLPGLRERASQLLHLPMTLEVAQDIGNLLNSLRKLDAKFAEWPFKKTANAISDFITVYVHELGPGDDLITSPIWPGEVHAYRSKSLANGANMYRIIRIICHGVIVNCLERLVPPEELPTHPDFLHSTRIMQRLANMVCSAIPFFYLDGPGDTSSSSPENRTKAEEIGRSSDDTSDPKPRIQIDSYRPLSVNIGGSGIIWHLLVVSQLRYISQEQRKWARHRMFALGHERGLDQAMVLAAMGDRRAKEGERLASIMDLVPLPYEPLEPDIFEFLADPELWPNLPGLSSRASTRVGNGGEKLPI